MKVLFVEDEGGVDVSTRATAHGHQCKVFTRQYDPHKRPVGKGLIDMVPDWRPWMRWADLVFLESNNSYMREMDNWRRQGCLIVGGNQDSADWEIDRSLGMQVFKRAGIAVPPFREFQDYDSAIAHVKRRDEPFASKPSGKCDDKSLSYVAKSPEDLVYQLTKWKTKHGRPPFPFVLQEKVKGIEFAVGAWFGPNGFVPGWEENFEFKKLMAGDTGPNTGEMGTVLRYVTNSKLADKVLLPLERQLERLGYIGNIDVNCIIDEHGDPWPLEFTTRFGWPTFTIQMSLFEWDPIEFLFEFAIGRSTRGAYRMNDVAVGVIPVLPPFPSIPKNYDDIIGIPILGAAEDFSFEEIMEWKGDRSGIKAKYASAGMIIGVATKTGATVQEAARKAYKELDQLSMPASPFWRPDIGDKLKKELPVLQEHGYAKGMAFN
jgi:phosphoribosylamine---glycine ligase